MVSRSLLQSIATIAQKGDNATWRRPQERMKSLYGSSTGLKKFPKRPKDNNWSLNIAAKPARTESVVVGDIRGHKLASAVTGNLAIQLRCGRNIYRYRKIDVLNGPLSNSKPKDFRITATIHNFTALIIVVVLVLGTAKCPSWANRGNPQYVSLSLKK